MRTVWNGLGTMFRGESLQATAGRHCLAPLEEEICTGSAGAAPLPVDGSPLTVARLDMSFRRKVAATFYVVNGLVSVGLGGLYLFRGAFMPYHAEALGRRWAEVEPALQTLIKALMDVAGAGWIGIGVATLVLVAVPMRRGETWGRLLIPGLFLIFYVPTLLATLAVLAETPASPPWYGNAIACLATVLGVAADAPWRTQGTDA